MEIICINHKTTRMPHGKYPHFSMAHLERKTQELVDWGDDFFLQGTCGNPKFSVQPSDAHLLMVVESKASKPL